MSLLKMRVEPIYLVKRAVSRRHWRLGRRSISAWERQHSCEDFCCECEDFCCEKLQNIDCTFNMHGQRWLELTRRSGEMIPEVVTRVSQVADLISCTVSWLTNASFLENPNRDTLSRPSRRITAVDIARCVSGWSTEL